MDECWCERSPTNPDQAYLPGKALRVNQPERLRAGERQRRDRELGSTPRRGNGVVSRWANREQPDVAGSNIGPTPASARGRLGGNDHINPLAWVAGERSRRRDGDLHGAATGLEARIWGRGSLPRSE